MGKEQMMNLDKRTFYKAGILLGVAAFFLDFFCLPLESIIVAVIGLVLCLKKRKEYRTLIGLVLSIYSIVSSAWLLGTFFYEGSKGLGSTDYWLFRLFFDAM